MNRFLRFAVVILVVAAVGTIAYLRLAPRPVSAAANLPTATVQRGALQATVSTAGNITPHQQVNLNFTQSGVVQQVNVKVGDHVKAGQVLGSLDTGNLALQVQNAQVNL